MRLSLSDAHENLIREMASANPKCAVVVEAGGAVTMEGWRDRVPAILMAWYAGMEGGNAIAGILFGEVNPSGKLPIVFPKSSDQLVKFDNRSHTVQYGYYQVTAGLIKTISNPLFHSDLDCPTPVTNIPTPGWPAETIGRSGKLVAEVDVKNTGKMAGEEIVQLYVGYHGSAVDRPVKDLKAFSRVSLAPGEKKTVNLQVNAADLAYYDADRKKWRVEEIEYEALVGPSSQKESLLGRSFRVSGA